MRLLSGEAAVFPAGASETGGTGGAVGRGRATFFCSAVLFLRRFLGTPTPNIY